MVQAWKSITLEECNDDEKSGGLPQMSRYERFWSIVLDSTFDLKHKCLKCIAKHFQYFRRSDRIPRGAKEENHLRLMCYWLHSLIEYLLPRSFLQSLVAEQRYSFELLY